ncbi:MAG: hypoxanthine phosphoribosyltransferase [Bacteroidales bacterium]|nr:hypoxanthine phosphoribosyltransferase [Bacteroidales bacterium]
MKEEKIKLFDKTFKPYIPHARIIEAIDGVAERVNADFRGCQDIPVVLCVLNGAIPFTGELLQRLDFNCQIVSIKMSSYQGTQSTGTVLNVMGLTSSVRGRRVIICEDIVDTGNTIVALKEMLLDKEGAADVRICTMLLKPDVYQKPDKIDYVGMSIPNAFIVGFGLDYNELGRNIPDIYVIDE